MSTDDTDAGLVDLRVLAGYRLVNLAAGSAPYAGRPDGGDRLALAAECRRDHEGRANAQPFLLAAGTVGDAGDGTSDNLADLARVAALHEAEHHDGDPPYLRWEVGADLDRLYGHTRTLWAGVEAIADALGVGWTTGTAERVLQVAARRLARVDPIAKVIRLTLPSLTSPVGRSIDYALTELVGDVVAELAGPDPQEPAEASARCAAQCPHAQAEKIAARSGVVRVDADWRCYLAPHIDGKHTVRPVRGGHLYHFTEDGATNA